MRNKKTATQVIDRIIVLSNYLNNISKGNTTRQDWEMCEDLGYSNRMQLHRDLKRLEDAGYITIDISILTPAKVEKGTAKQLIKKRRVIQFKPSRHGLLALPKKRQPGDILGKAIYNRKEVIYRAEHRNNGKWMKGPDHTLILNPDYIE